MYHIFYLSLPDPVSTTSVFSTVSSVLTSSYTGSDSYTTLARAKYANKSFDDTKKSLDDQLKELDSQLDSQLLSKVGHGGESLTYYQVNSKYIRVGFLSFQFSVI
jgi:hypothetical protein